MLPRDQIGKTLLRSPAVARRARAPLMWPPVITFCGLPPDPREHDIDPHTATRLICLSVCYRAACAGRTRRLLSSRLSKAI